MKPCRLAQSRLTRRSDVTGRRIVFRRETRAPLSIDCEPSSPLWLDILVETGP